MSQPLRVGDLVSCPPVRTVIQVADLQDAGRRRELAATFVLTGETSRAAQAILGAMVRGEGQGVFLHGHYGSGKSHFLTVLELLVTEPWARGALDPEGRLPAPQGRFLSVAISLVEHSAAEALEAVVLGALAARLGLPPRLDRQTHSRGAAFQALQDALQQAGYTGLLLLVDELSEFLRAKPDGRAFNEDIRFLQFLGEWAPRVPAWVVATLQEAIEQTGEILPEAFNKIQDRYPLRFRLSGQHIRELVARRLLPRRPGAEAALADLHGRLRRAFSGLPYSREEFLDLYPVHPGTVAFLEELKPLFSQHRGVVDFIHHQVQGDPDRSIPGLLASPAGELLAPDRIFDHFRDRIRSLPELAPYSEQVVHYFEGRVAALFPDAGEQETALRAVKLLALAALAGQPRPLTARDVAHLLLHRLTDWDPEVNYEYVRELLCRLVEGGAYLVREAGPAPAADSFRVDLEADAGLLLRRKVEYVRRGLLPGDRRVFTRLVAGLDWPFLPLAALAAAGEPSPRQVRWQRTLRQGLVLLADLPEVAPGAFREQVQATGRSEVDFLLYVAHPLDPDAAARHWQEELAPALGPAPAGAVVAAWVPAPVSDRATLEEALAHELVRAEVGDDPSAAGARLRPLLERLCADFRLRVRELYRAAYFSGRLLTAAGEELPVPAAVGATGFEAVLERLLDPLLAARFPRHGSIAPQSELLTPPAVAQALEQLLLPGETENGAPAVKLVAEGFLAPMGLVRRQGRGYRLAVQPGQNQLVTAFLALMEDEQTPLWDLYWHLRKSPWGLHRDAFQLLALSLMAAGLVTGYTGGRRVPLSQLTPHNFWKLEALGRGELLAPELQPRLAELPHLPARLTRGPLTLMAQREAWDATVAWKRRADELLAGLAARLPALQQQGALAALDFARVQADLEQVRAVLAEVKVSYGAREGLERFLARAGAAPYFRRQWERLEALARFLDTELDLLLRIHAYLTDPALELPADPPYAGLRQARQELLGALGREDTLLDAAAWVATTSAFSRFQDEYVAAYLQEHRRERGPERFAAYAALRSSAGYQALAQCARLEAVAAATDLVAVNRRLAAALGQACAGCSEDLLRRQPACACGFRLGQTLALPPVAEIAGAVEEGLREYLRELQAPRCASRLQAHLDTLTEVGRRREAEPVRRLLDLDPQAPDLLRVLPGLFTRPAVDLINAALRGQVLLVRRDLDTLYGQLLGRTFTPEQLLAAVQAWLGAVPPEAYIRVEGARDSAGVPAEVVAATAQADTPPQGPAEAPAPLAAFLADHFPDLIAPLRTWGYPAFLRAVAALHWAAAHGLPPAAVAPWLPAPAAGTDPAPSLAALAAALWGASRLPGAPDPGAGVADALDPDACWSELRSATEPSAGPEAWIDAIVREPFLPGLVTRAGAELVGSLERAGARVLQRAAGYLERAGGWIAEEGFGTALTRAQRHTLATAALLVQVRLAGLEAGARAGRWPADGDFAGWERAYTPDLALWAYREGALAQAAALAGLEDRVPLGLLRQERRQRQGEWDRAFADWCGRNWPPGARAGPGRAGPLTLGALLVQRAPELARRTGARCLCPLWLDGLRLDLWHLLRPGLVAAAGVREVAGGILWAALPSVTDTQVQGLRAAGWAGSFQVADHLGPRAVLAAAATAGLRFNFIDEKVHSSRSDYLSLCEEVRLQAQRRVLPLLREAPAGTLFLLFGDHGFREGTGEPRYLHGGASPAEVLVPWAALLKPGSTPG